MVNEDEALFDRGRPPTAEERARGTIWVLDEKSAEEVAAEKAAAAALEAQQDVQLTAFLAELTELSRKYQLTISGCGCCGSPFLEKLTEPGKYIARGDDLRWEESNT